jgi:hypothetical protein
MVQMWGPYSGLASYHECGKCHSNWFSPDGEVASTEGEKTGWEFDPTGLSDIKMTKRVLESVAKPGALVFDPCCGKGMTAKAAHFHDMRFAGVELNPKRAAVTRKFLESKVGGRR